jgi:hypothetical protein
LHGQHIILFTRIASSTCRDNPAMRVVGELSPTAVGMQHVHTQVQVRPGDFSTAARNIAHGEDADIRRSMSAADLFAKSGRIAGAAAEST